MHPPPARSHMCKIRLLSLMSLAWFATASVGCGDHPEVIRDDDPFATDSGGSAGAPPGVTNTTGQVDLTTTTGSGGSGGAPPFEGCSDGEIDARSEEGRVGKGTRARGDGDQSSKRHMRMDTGTG